MSSLTPPVQALGAPMAPASGAVPVIGGQRLPPLPVPPGGAPAPAPRRVQHGPGDDPTYIASQQRQQQAAAASQRRIAQMQQARANHFRGGVVPPVANPDPNAQAAAMSQQMGLQSMAPPATGV